MANARDLTAILSDTRMTPDARCVVAHIYLKGPGPQEIPFIELASVLNNPRKGRTQEAIKLAVALGWIRRQKGGGGHGDTFEYTDPNSVSTPVVLTESVSTDAVLTESVSTPVVLTERPVSTDAVLTDAPHTCETRSPSFTSSSPSSPRAHAREEDLDRLKSYLGEHSEAADCMDGSAEHPPNWAAHVFASYCREPSIDPLLDSTPSDQRPAVVALALSRYAAEGCVFSPPYFRGFLTKAAKHKANGAADTTPSAAALPCTIEDIKTLLSAGGSDLHFPTTRLRAFARCEEKHPALWARAGPIFKRLQDFAGMIDLKARHDRFGLDQKIRDQLNAIARDTAAA